MSEISDRKIILGPLVLPYETVVWSPKEVKPFRPGGTWLTKPALVAVDEWLCHTELDPLCARLGLSHSETIIKLVRDHKS